MQNGNIEHYTMNRRQRIIDFVADPSTSRENNVTNETVIHLAQDNVTNETVTHLAWDKVAIFKLMNHKHELVRSRLACVFRRTTNISFIKVFSSMLSNKFYYVDKHNFHTYYECRDDISPLLMNRGKKIIKRYRNRFTEGKFIDYSPNRYLVNFAIKELSAQTVNCIDYVSWTCKISNLKMVLKCSVIVYSNIFYLNSEKIHKPYPCDMMCLIVVIREIEAYPNDISISLATLQHYSHNYPIMKYLQLTARKRKKKINMVDPNGNAIEKITFAILQKFTNKNMIKLISYFI